MKKTLYYLLLLSLAFTFSCSDSGSDDGGNDKPTGKFVWDGDWNDPSHPKYTNGKFNPPLGTWEDKTHTLRFEFTSELTQVRLTRENTSQIFIEERTRVYEINKQGYMTIDESGKKVYNAYVVKGNFLYIMIAHDDMPIYPLTSKQWNVFTSVD